VRTFCAEVDAGEIFIAIILDAVISRRRVLSIVLFLQVAPLVERSWDGIVFVFVVALGIAVRVVAAPHCLVVLAVAFLVVFTVTPDVGRYK
jgi:hypothetical protein